MKKEVNDKKRKQLLKVQLTLMEEYIWKEEAKNNVKNIEKELEKLKKAGGTNSNAFWEFKKQIEKKNKKEELPKSMKNKEGKVKTEKNEIIKIFEEFYEELFINIDEESVNSVRAKEIREIIFNSIKSLAKMEKTETPITKKEIIETINELKNKNTRDSQGWSNVILKNAGTDVIESIEILLNEIEKKVTMPNEWIEMLIISLYKNKGDKEDMENRRGLFITSTISKIYEKIKQKRKNEEIEKKVSKYQCGGRKQRSTLDHILTLNTIIDYN